MDIKDFQKDMRLAYLGGAPGALVSGIIWLIAGILAIYTSNQTSILVFFFGGMLIFPFGMVIAKLFNRTGKHRADNPLGTLAMESTFLLFVGLFIAYSVFQINQTWFFPIMLLIIGSRYLLFQTIYGMKIYWILGLTLAIAGVIVLLTNQIFPIAALIGGGIEIVFSMLIFKLERKITPK